MMGRIMYGEMGNSLEHHLETQKKRRTNEDVKMVLDCSLRIVHDTVGIPSPCIAKSMTVVPNTYGKVADPVAEDSASGLVGT